MSDIQQMAKSNFHDIHSIEYKFPHHQEIFQFPPRSLHSHNFLRTSRATEYSVLLLQHIETVASRSKVNTVLVTTESARAFSA